MSISADDARAAPHTHYCYDCQAPWTHADAHCPPREWGRASYLCGRCCTPLCGEDHEPDDG